ncbi:ASN_collapsed_G0016810.mRNA.1.CDS.1 [Saccharomyces cerevisiae]|nr:ASN_collapsed_G0016810.mRNA.1.CDS.1 [Saccharomyces cerevisiae]
MSIPHSVFSAVLVFVALATTTLASTEACLPTNKREDGMNINFYEYTIGDKTTYLEPEYMGYKYSDTKKLGSVSGQTDLSIYYSPPCESTPTCVTYAVLKRDEDGYDPCGPLYETKKRDTEYCDPNTAYWSSDLFGFYTTPTNVTLEMTGYFLPPQTGSYTFKFATVDDSAILSVGGATAFDCCAQQQPPITSTNFTINGIKPWGGSLPPNVIGGTVYIVTLPDGTAISDDFEGYVYSFDDDLTQSDCTIPDPSNYTITGLITTTTEPWTGTFTSTSTEMTTVTGTNGQPTDETVIVIRTPTTAISSSLSSSSSEQITSSITQEITSSLPPVTSATTSQETASSLPPVTSATTGQETASSLLPATTTKTSEQTTLVTVTSCESHVCTESISSAIVSTATVIVSGVTTEYTTWCPISTTEITKQTTETTKQTKGTTEQTTETTKQTTVVTISSCESDICSKTASPAIVSTSTATINDVTTEYTTWCPISTTESKQQTTLVTVTSCESGVCSETTSPAIVSTATATVNDVVTVYPYMEATDYE